jgi:hypothetical protein
LNLLPYKKTTIELKETDCFRNHKKINEVFILSDDSKDHIEILERNNKKSKIMKDAILRMIDENN